MPSHGFTCMPLCVCLSARPQVRREDAAAAQGERGGEQQAVACACNVCDMRPGARDQSESRRGRRRPQDTGHLRSRSRQIFVIHFTRLTSPPPPLCPQAFADELHAREFRMPRREVQCVSHKRAVMQVSVAGRVACVCAPCRSRLCCGRSATRPMATMCLRALTPSRRWLPAATRCGTGRCMGSCSSSGSSSPVTTRADSGESATRAAAAPAVADSPLRNPARVKCIHASCLQVSVLETRALQRMRARSDTHSIWR